MEDGTPLDPDKTYTVAISQFLQEGGDGTDAFLDNTLLTNSMVTDVEAFIAYLKGEVEEPIDEEPTTGSSNAGIFAAVVGVFAAIAGLFQLFCGPLAAQIQQMIYQFM